MNQLPNSLNMYAECDGPDGCLFRDHVVAPPTAPPTMPPTAPPTAPPTMPPEMKREITDGLTPFELSIEYNVGDDMSPTPNISCEIPSAPPRITKSMRQQAVHSNELPWTNGEEEMSELCDGFDMDGPPPPQMVRQNTLCIPRDALSDAVEEMRTILENPRLEPSGSAPLRVPYVGDPMSRSPMTMRMFDDDGSPLTTQLLHERLGNLKKSLNECVENIRLVEKHYL